MSGNPSDSPRTKSHQSRRAFLAATGAAGLTAAAGCIGGGGSTPTINILTWEEYANEDIKSRIEEEVGVTLEITKSTSSSNMFSSWNAGQYQQYDIAIPNNNYVPKMMDTEKDGEPMIAPVDEEAVSNFDAMYDVFQGFADSQFTANGNRYGVPIRFGWYGYSYDSRSVPDHEDSYKALFDENYVDADLSGKIVMYDNHFKAMSAAALYLGHGDAFEGSRVTLSQDQIDEVKQTLIDQKPNLQGYIAADPTYIKSLKQGNFVIGQSGRNEIVEMWSNDNDWPSMATPKEGSLAWFESAVVSSASENKTKSWEVINEYISAKNGATLAKTGFSPSVNPNTQEQLTDEQNEMYGAVDPSRLEQMIPFKAVENEDAWITAWEEVKSA
ncbi:ABC transporter substrate-binding protein [Halolamina salifodinae]|uniref:Spermidine/putrescine transport system substrate-binding protein n=1 Tax=Halolamina salifodinae TaxID=1202767 RepID=A0A8T4GXB7_9EURY|nr:extracellular solute-binding protein [Halolamina salifodinae]MBP1986713.1 spermidine/putrescine transport system substrate-binding protein [Halolamina salifodinae]